MAPYPSTSHILQWVKDSSIRRGDGAILYLSFVTRPTSVLINFYYAVQSLFPHSTLRWTLGLRVDQMWICPSCDDADLSPPKKTSTYKKDGGLGFQNSKLYICLTSALLVIQCQTNRDPNHDTTLKYRLKRLIGSSVTYATDCHSPDH